MKNKIIISEKEDNKIFLIKEYKKEGNTYELTGNWLVIDNNRLLKGRKDTFLIDEITLEESYYSI